MTTLAKGTGASGTAVAWAGDLEIVPLAEVIRRIVVDERSGELRCTSASAVKTIHFDRGFIVFASSNLKSDSLGERLISSGRISPHEFALVKMLTKGSKRSFRQTLSHAGIVPEEELGRHVAAQVNQIVLSMFPWKEGTYRFEEAPCTIPLELMVSLSAHRIMLEGIRRMSSGKLILAGLPPLDTMIRVVQAPPFSLDFEKLRQVERSVLRIADTRISIRQILTRAGDDKGKVLRACYGLYASGVLEPVSEGARRTPRPVQEETGTFVVSEILRKITPKEHAVREVPESPRERVREVASAPSPDSPRSRPPVQARAEETPAKPALKSFEEFEAEQAAATGDTLPAVRGPKDGKWSQVFSAVVATATALWAAVSAAVRGAQLLWNELRGNARAGSKTTEDTERAAPFEESSAAIETFEPSERVPSSWRPHRTDQVGQEDASEGPSVPSWSVVDDPQDAPLPATDPMEFLGQSEEGPEITRLGVPKWSLRDDPNEAPAPPTDTYQETLPERAPPVERFQPPSWSLEDPRPTTRKARSSPPPAPPAEIVLGREDMELPEPADRQVGPEIVLGLEEEAAPTAPPKDASASTEFDDPFADPLFGHPDDRPPSTQELFIELEPEEDTESSMLNAIPVEDVHVEDEPDLVIVIEEDAFEDLPDVPEDPTPPPAPQPQTVAPPAEAKKPAKVATPPKAEEPAPVHAAKPTPVHAAKPAPVHAAKPTPVQAAKPTPVQAAKPIEPAPQKKLPGPPRIVPKVETPPMAPRSRPAASPSFNEAPSPSFNEDSVPIFAETPLAEPPRPAAPISADRPPSPVAAVKQAPPMRPPASPVVPVKPAPPARPPASPVAASPVAAPSARRGPQAPPPVASVTEQPVAQPSAGDIAVNEGLMRANRIRQRGGEKRLLRDVKLHFKVQDWAGAVPLLEELVAIAPGSALYRGMLARAMSRHPTLRSDAEEHFHEALRLAPQDPEIHYWLGVYYLSFGLKARAINEFKTTLRINPNHERARKQLVGGRGGGGGVFKKLFG
jgi:hypothetical protein